jgi:hypothetical protein
MAPIREAKPVSTVRNILKRCARTTGALRDATAHWEDSDPQANAEQVHRSDKGAGGRPGIGHRASGIRHKLMGRVDGMATYDRASGATAHQADLRLWLDESSDEIVANVLVVFPGGRDKVAAFSASERSEGV